jgi:hypothetical protein
VTKLRNVFQRIATQWRPANAEESYEIVRRRLFENLSEKAFTDRDLVVRAFTDHYAKHSGEFPAECRDPDYLRKMQLAYPVHPEVFERLYQDWSGLVRFQRTRGVLRLMASVIHHLWECGDQGLLILPAHIPIAVHGIGRGLLAFLPSGWDAVIEKDVDGAECTPRKIDAEKPNLGRISATRRVARTLFIGSAPTSDAANRGMEDRRIKLGCTLPGESPAVFGDALRYLAQAATYLYQDSSRYWYATQPTVAKLAADRAEELKRHRDKVLEEIRDRINEDLRGTGKRGDFARVHAFPASGADVQDERSVGLVILGPEHEWAKEPVSPALEAAKAILSQRGNSPRIYQNSLVFLAADRARLAELEQAVRSFLAWESILSDAQGDQPKLNLDNFQRAQATAQRKATDQMVQSRINETYQMVLAPTQETPSLEVTWTSLRATGTDSIVVRAGRKLVGGELLVPDLAATRLKLELDKVPLWNGDYVGIRELLENFARYIYLPRLRGSEVLVGAISEGVELLTWDKESFAYAEGWDDAAKRFRALRCGQRVDITEDNTGVLVKPEPARRQYEAERTPGSAGFQPASAFSTSDAHAEEPRAPGQANAGRMPALRRFHGTAQLDPQRVGRDAGTIAQEVISHLAGIIGADVKVTIEIDAYIPTGAGEQIVRTVTENCRTLKFTSQGFEQE